MKITRRTRIQTVQFTYQSNTTWENEKKNFQFFPLRLYLLQMQFEFKRQKYKFKTHQEKQEFPFDLCFEKPKGCFDIQHCWIAVATAKKRFLLCRNMTRNTGMDSKRCSTVTRSSKKRQQETPKPALHHKFLVFASYANIENTQKLEHQLVLSTRSLKQ